MNKPEICRVAIIGAGKIAREHARAFRDVPGVSLAGIHSRTRSRAEALASEFGISTVSESVAELYERTRANIVVITVCVTEMSVVSRSSFEFPWTVLMEKPIGYNWREAREVQQAAAERNSKVLVGLNRRFLSSTRAAQADLDQSRSPRYIHVQDQQSLAQAAAAGHPRIVIENWMYANSIHLIDYLRAFGRGAVAKVTPIVRWNAKAPGLVLAKIEFESGDMGLYEGIWDGPGPWAVSVTTPEKRWEMRPLERAGFQSRGERRLRQIELSRWDQDFKAGFRLQAEMAVASAMGRSSDAPALDEAMETMKLIKEIFGQ